MKRFFLVYYFGLVTSFVFAQSSEIRKYNDAFALIDNWLGGQRDFDRIPGLSVAIVKDQNVIWSKGYGYSDLDKKVPMEPQTICSICSISKLFTSIAVMQLVERGKIRLDDSISAVLPSFNLKQQYPQSGPITIRSLLTHSSGLPREADFAYWSAPDFSFPTQQQMDEKLGGQKTLYPASTYFQYSNLGMSILGEVVAHVSGLPYEQYVEDNILKPMGLTETHPFLPENLWGGKMATGYGGIHRDSHRDKMPFFKPNGITPAAGFSSSVNDLAKFAGWQFKLLANGGREIIKASTLRDMQRVQFLDPDWKTARGLGFALREANGRTLVGHGGSCPGYLSSLTEDPKEKLAVIIMINAQGESLDKYYLPILNVLKMADQAAGTAAVDSSNLDPYIGNYDFYAFGSELVVLKWYGKLAVLNLRSEDPAGDLTLCKHVSGDTFRIIRKNQELGEEITFERDKNGKVTRVWRSNNFYNKIQR